MHNTQFRKYAAALAALLLSGTIQLAAQETTSTADKAFSHLEVGVSAGTTGIGFDLKTNISPIVDVRMGADFYPRFNSQGDFKVMVGNNPEQSKSRFERLQELMQNMTGLTVDDKVTMNRKPTMDNFKLLVDVKPFVNKKWHLTAGFYWGSKTIATAENDIVDMASLLAMSMYNKMYINAINDEPIFTYGETDIYYPSLANYGSMGVRVAYWKNDGTHTDVDGNQVEHKAGDPYRMFPDNNSMVSAKAQANAFKPYLGFGYGGRLIKGKDQWNITFDCGAMFWGGSPALVTHDGTDLVRDVEKVSGKVNNYVKLAKILKVCPVIDVRVAYRLF